jgi:taurine dioxygenase
MITTSLAPFGAEVRGLDLTSLAVASFDGIAALIARSRVVVFRDQPMGDAAFVQFLKGLGELTFTEGETPAQHAPDLNVVTNVGRTTPPQSVFHTDTSYVACPPAFTALRPVVLPASGGDTLFSDQVRAAANLPEKVRQYLTGKTVLHAVTGLDGQSATTRQPLLRRHPITAEVALYLSTPQRCTQLSGVDERTSERIVAALYRHSIRPAALYRHQWRPGDVLIWDNRVTMHRADHGDVTQDRVLHRGMVMGEAPVMA